MPRLVMLGTLVLMCLSCATTTGQVDRAKCLGIPNGNSGPAGQNVGKQNESLESHTGGWLYAEPVRFHNAGDDFYRAVVAGVFASEGYVGSCFQMVTLVEGEPEEVVFAQCGVTENSADVELTHLVASESIREKVRISGLDGVRDIKTRRTECRLGFEDARLLRRLWSRMLEKTAVKTGTRLRERRRDYFFSTFREGLFQGQLGGVAENPPEGSVSAELVEIGRLLSRVADSENERERNVALLRTAAGKILQQLEGRVTK